jgi:DNA-binding response OmpR family regulator
MRVLLVEDEEDMARLVTAALSRHDVIVDHAPNLEYAEEAVQAGVHDAVLLDRKLPDGEGLSLIPVIRRVQPGLPIIVLSALGSPENRVAGLDGGADDYLAKPFSVDELLARLRAVMRRPAQIGQDVVTVGRLRFNLNDRSAEIDGAPLERPRRELLALETLVRRSGRTVPRGALEEAVYGFDDDIASNTLDAHISRLRRKLVPADVEIHAIRGLGYLLRVAA